MHKTIFHTIGVLFINIDFLYRHLRLIVCPRKIKFMKNAMNMVDLVAILPFFVSLVIEGLEVRIS